MRWLPSLNVFAAAFVIHAVGHRKMPILIWRAELAPDVLLTRCERSEGAIRHYGHQFTGAHGTEE